jgi:hypothetical protein
MKPAQSTGVRLGMHRDLRALGRAANLLGRSRGHHLAIRRETKPGLLGVLRGACDSSNSGSRGRVLDGAGDAPVGNLGGRIGALRVRCDLPDRFLLVGDQPRELDTFCRMTLLPVSALLGHRGHQGDARNDYRQGATDSGAAGHLDTGFGRGSGWRIGHRVLQGCLMRICLLE